jgi:hypothetical protein
MQCGHLLLRRILRNARGWHQLHRLSAIEQVARVGSSCEKSRAIRLETRDEWGNML